EIEARLGAGDEVVLRGFGTFHLKRVGAKRLRLPGGKTVDVPAGTCPAWRPAEALKKRMMEGFSGSGDSGFGTAPKVPDPAVDSVSKPQDPQSETPSRS
ncbi:MAG TPA: HU family DNA-binding protein, partial [Candidatus Brocadiia bacterium]|nr:HU family DNA-binding protein [Candidatus Brocadiia bacterium]